MNDESNENDFFLEHEDFLNSFFNKENEMEKENYDNLFDDIFNYNINNIENDNVNLLDNNNFNDTQDFNFLNINKKLLENDLTNLFNNIEYSIYENNLYFNINKITDKSLSDFRIDSTFKTYIINTFISNLPKQTNSHDCGLYLLKYIELILKNNFEFLFKYNNHSLFNINEIEKRKRKLNNNNNLLNTKNNNNIINNKTISINTSLLNLQTLQKQNSNLIINKINTNNLFTKEYILYFLDSFLISDKIYENFINFFYLKQILYCRSTICDFRVNINKELKEFYNITYNSIENYIEINYEKEKQLKFLKETIYCNPSKLDVSQEEDDDYRYPGRYFIGISFVNKLIIIGYNGNCSNKFIYEGGAGAERYHDFELKETNISLTYQLSKSINKNEEETSTSKEEEIKEEDTIELFSSEKEGTYGECFKNVDTNEALKFFEELRKELGYNELTNKDFIDTLVYKLNDYYKSLDFDNYIDCFCDNFVSVEDFIKEINNDENDDDGDKEEEKELKEEEE
ncbi:hypothetical protein ABK040_016208 [Willaertia magna]